MTHNSVADIATAWSATGRWLVSQRARDTSLRKWDLWTMRSDGSGQRLLAADGTRPAWSPNGRLVAFGESTGQIRGCGMLTNLTLIGSGTHGRSLVKTAAGPPGSRDDA